MKAGWNTHGWPRVALRSIALGVFVAIAGLGGGCKKEADQTTTLSPEEISMLSSNVSRGAPVPQNQPPARAAAPTVSPRTQTPQMQSPSQVPAVTANANT